MTPKELKKRKFWDKFKRKTSSNELVVTAVDQTAGTVTMSSQTSTGTITVLPSAYVPNNTMYYVSPQTYSTWTSSGSSGSILTTSGTGNIQWVNPIVYSISNGEDSISCNEEEYKLAMRTAYDFLQKKRQYKEDFQELLK